MVGETGFEPVKSLTTDLQSAPFDRTWVLSHIGADSEIRTRTLRIEHTDLNRACIPIPAYLHIVVLNPRLELGTPFGAGSGPAASANCAS